MEFIKEPSDIEKKSMQIIDSELNKENIEKENLSVVKRVIHTTADFDYAQNLCFSKNVVKIFKEILLKGVTIVTDTNMVLSGINKYSLAKLNCTAICFMDYLDVKEEASKRKITRASVSIEKAVNELETPIIFAVGNAPTAVLKIHELLETNVYKPSGIIAVPVGFVNVVESKELIVNTDCNFIVAKGRKGGSNVAAAICNAIIYETLNDLGLDR